MIQITQVCNLKTARDSLTVCYRFLLTETGENIFKIQSRHVFLQNSCFLV